MPSFVLESIFYFVIGTIISFVILFLTIYDYTIEWLFFVMRLIVCFSIGCITAFVTLFLTNYNEDIGMFLMGFSFGITVWRTIILDNIFMYLTILYFIFLFQNLQINKYFLFGLMMDIIIYLLFKMLFINTDIIITYKNHLVNA